MAGWTGNVQPVFRIMSMLGFVEICVWLSDTDFHKSYKKRSILYEDRMEFRTDL